MYVPASFEVADRSTIRDFLRANAFGTLVTAGAQGLFASHIPFLYAADRGPQGTLVAHLARANPHGADLEGGTALAIFAGAHAYVSPRWYAEPHRAVPTWNFTAVHCIGRARLVREPAALARIVTELSAAYEPAGGWSPARMTPGLFEATLQGIVGLEIAVERIEAKFKLSQNRGAIDRHGVIAGLHATGRPGDAELADAMTRHAFAKEKQS